MELPELKPRNQCLDYISRKRTNNPILLTKKEFDEHVRAKRFADGPFRDCFGDGNEPYNPCRQAFGHLDDNRVVYCELSSSMEKKVYEYLKVNQAQQNSNSGGN